MSLNNECRFRGNVGADPKVYRNPNTGSLIVRFSMATTDKKVDTTNGEIFDKTEWHRIVSYGKTAENIAKYVRKGQLVDIRSTVQHYESRTEFRVLEFDIIRFKKRNSQDELEEPDIYESLEREFSDETNEN